MAPCPWPVMYIKKVVFSPGAIGRSTDELSGVMYMTMCHQTG
jgi:hypothetical protein